ncbi:hypothetical protein WUBG_17046, partial [Wuchereria bancrofti]
MREKLSAKINFALVYDIAAVTTATANGATASTAGNVVKCCLYSSGRAGGILK